MAKKLKPFDISRLYAPEPPEPPISESDEFIEIVENVPEPKGLFAFTGDLDSYIEAFKVYRDTLSETYHTVEMKPLYCYDGIEGYVFEGRREETQEEFDARQAELARRAKKKFDKEEAERRAEADRQAAVEAKEKELLRQLKEKYES